MAKRPSYSNRWREPTERPGPGTERKARATLIEKRKAFVKFVGKQMTRTDFHAEMDRLGVSQFARDDLVRRAERLRKLGVTANG